MSIGVLGLGVCSCPVGKNPTLYFQRNRITFPTKKTTFYSVIIKQINDLIIYISELNYLVSSLETNQLRFYSTKKSNSCSTTSRIKPNQNKNNENNNGQLHPLFITGFVDGEGCFAINIFENKELKIGWVVWLSFSIGLHVKDRALLERITKSLGVGRISKGGAEKIQLRVTSKEDLTKIIEHFDKFPLITNKWADYELWKKAFYLIQNQEHLTEGGLKKIVSLKANQNLGLSEKLKKAFSDVSPVARPIVKDQTIKDPNWLAGFASGESSFNIIIQKSKGYSTGYSVWLEIDLTQHSRDEQLLTSFIKYLNCGYVTKNRFIFNYRVTKLSEILNKILPFFNKHKIKGEKSKDFEDFCKVAEMMKEKKHLTNEGLEQIKKIKAGMNRGRKWD